MKVTLNLSKQEFANIVRQFPTLTVVDDEKPVNNSSVLSKTLKAPKNPVPLNHNSRWQPKELRYLTNNYGTLDSKQMSKKLGRSQAAILTKASELGITGGN